MRSGQKSRASAATKSARPARSPTGTLVSWSQAFESDFMARRLEHTVVPANEQNLDRLTAEVLRD